MDKMQKTDNHDYNEFLKMCITKNKNYLLPLKTKYSDFFIKQEKIFLP